MDMLVQLPGPARSLGDARVGFVGQRVGVLVAGDPGERHADHERRVDRDHRPWRYAEADKRRRHDGDDPSGNLPCSIPTLALGHKRASRSAWIISTTRLAIASMSSGWMRIC